ncbi:hypothetical protein IKG02_03175 [Candidatus Saccharibacteria bacterium]|nr:hypothetical protein [Candidatus Saccharibacteria bacterium]
MKNYFVINPKNILLIVIFSVFFGVVGTTSTFAKGAVMKISPVATQVYIEEGNKQNYQFTVENAGDEDFSFKLYTAPYSVTNEDYDADFSQETNYNQIMRWITFQDDSGSFVTNPVFKVKAGEKRTIIYRVSVPDSIPEGGQYCTIFAESVKEDGEESKGASIGIESHSRVSLIVLGHGDGTTENVAEITDFGLTGFFTTKDIEAHVKVKNNGNTDFIAIYSLAVNSIFGTPLYSMSDNFVVLPQTERKYTTNWAETPLFGIYKANFSVTAMDQKQEVSRFILIMPAFMIVILLLLLTSIIVWSIMIFRKRKERSSRLVV